VFNGKKEVREREKERERREEKRRERMGAEYNDISVI